MKRASNPVSQALEGKSSSFKNELRTAVGQHGPSDYDHRRHHSYSSIIHTMKQVGRKAAPKCGKKLVGCQGLRGKSSQPVNTRLTH